MNVSGISSTGMISGGGSVDEEYKRIIAKLLEYGIMPSGNKSADKAKLREIEMQKLKSELGPKGTGSANPAKYVTISAAEIQQIKEKLQTKKRDQETIENKEKQKAAENRTGDTQIAELNKYYFIKKVNKLIG